MSNVHEEGGQHQPTPTAQHTLGAHQSKLTQLEINSMCSDNSGNHPQYYQFIQSGVYSHLPQQQLQYFNPYSVGSGGGSGGVYGQQQQQVIHQDETPKYIKNLRGELNVALKKNMELRIKLETMEEEQEIGL